MNRKMMLLLLLRWYTDDDAGINAGHGWVVTFREAVVNGSKSEKMIS